MLVRGKGDTAAAQDGSKHFFFLFWPCAAALSLSLSLFRRYAFVDGPELDLSNACSQIEVTIDANGLWLSFNDITLCPGCSLVGAHEFAELPEGTVVIVMHKDWLTMDMVGRKGKEGRQTRDVKIDTKRAARGM